MAIDQIIVELFQPVGQSSKQTIQQGDFATPNSQVQIPGRQRGTSNINRSPLYFFKMTYTQTQHFLKRFLKSPSPQRNDANGCRPGICHVHIPFREKTNKRQISASTKFKNLAAPCLKGYYFAQQIKTQFSKYTHIQIKSKEVQYSFFLLGGGWVI